MRLIIFITLLFTTSLFADSLNEFYCEGKTSLSYLDEETAEKHTLTCFGPVTLDNQKGMLTLEARHKNLLDNRNQQILFQDRIGEIKADFIEANYTTNVRQIIPNKIVLKGHISIIQNGHVNTEDSRPLLQYALADSIEFFPNDNIMILYADEGNRVLFFDKIQDFQMSADKVIIKRNELNKQESIQGIGKVHFIFNEDELVRFQKNFFIQED